MQLVINHLTRMKGERICVAGIGAFLPVTDLRFFEPDATVRPAVIEAVAGRLRRGVEPRLMLGLGRAWTKDRDDQPRHWLQVNGLCLEDQPLGAGEAGV